MIGVRPFRDASIVALNIVPDVAPPERPAAEVDADGTTLRVGLLREPPPAEEREAVMAARSDIDDFHVRGREVYCSAAPA